MRRWLGAAILVIALPVGVSWAHPTFESLWEEATEGTGCTPKDYPDFILVTCEPKITLWYFTKPNHPAHPGVIKRWVEEKDGDLYLRLEGKSFAPDSGQPAFKAWLAQIDALNSKAQEEIARRTKQSGATSE